jgi:hypothetical protein
VASWARAYADSQAPALGADADGHQVDHRRIAVLVIPLMALWIMNGYKNLTTLHSLSARVAGVNSGDEPVPVEPDELAALLRSAANHPAATRLGGRRK